MSQKLEKTKIQGSSSSFGDSDISRLLIAWYTTHRRDLPWRETSDPYAIWISEVILQQTRVAQGLDYYLRFLERFPRVETLAAAAENDVLKLWQGLGYYSRARNLQAAARDVVERFGGTFPRDYTAIRSLKGIGDYTAAAICSFAYGAAHATVDGNVYRVLARLFDVDLPIDSTEGKRFFGTLATTLLDSQDPATHNQAIMEFGALQCLPKSPDCPNCPLHGKCLAVAHKTVEMRPVKSGKTNVRSRYFNYLHIRCAEKTLLAQRGPKDIWQHLYEFPLIETPGPVEWPQLQQEPLFLTWFQGIAPLTLLHQKKRSKHQLSHQSIYASFYEIWLTAENATLLWRNMSQCRIVTEEELTQFPIARLTERYLESRSSDSATLF